MEDLDICWIKVISDSGYRTDLRNEASAKTGRQLAEIPFVQRKMEKVAEEMPMDNRKNFILKDRNRGTLAFGLGFLVP